MTGPAVSEPVPADDGDGNSHRDILRSSAIIGGASVLNIALGLARLKAAALLLGPAGVGLIGLFQNLLTAAAALVSLGFGTVGTRQIAEANGRGDGRELASARRALMDGSLILGIVGAALMWALRQRIASWVLDDPRQADAVGWLSIGLVLSVVFGAQQALLTGMRRIADVAWASVLSAVLATLLAVGALILWGANGVIAFVVATPIAAVVFGSLFVARLPRLTDKPGPGALAAQWRTMARLGFAFTVAGLATTGGQLVARTLIQRGLGPAELGMFQASWMISMTYIGFVLQAMGTDYYPRVAAATDRPDVMNRLANEQTEVALLLGGSALLGTLGLAPWIIQLLYSSAFADAATILRWQILGDLFKVASWPLGFILLALGAGRAYMVCEVGAIIVFVALTFLLLPPLGVEAGGVAFLGMYAFYLPAVFVAVTRRTGFAWTAANVRLFAGLAAAALTVLAAAAAHRYAGAVAGVAIGGLAGLHALDRLEAALPARLGPLARLARRVLHPFAPSRSPR